MFRGWIRKDKGVSYQVIEVFSITIRSLKNGELRKNDETRILKTFNQPGLASETLHYLPVVLTGEAKGEERYRSSILFRQIGFDSSFPCPPLGLCRCCLCQLSWGRGQARCPCPLQLCCASQYVPPILYSALLASVLARVSESDEIQARIQQNHSKDNCWQQGALDYSELMSILLRFLSILLLFCSFLV